ncbi:L,D-transpeptidase [Sphingomonas sp. PB2P12]|uniref:L,D-transpeptidase n=1 Tax=Sphingomonas sandaracina TaxID=3096157 RepID=UPI002FC73E3D
MLSLAVAPCGSSAQTAGRTARQAKASPAKAGSAKASSAKTTHAKRKVASTQVAAPPSIPTESASRLIAWIHAAQDNGALPYIVIDKPAALLYLFAADGKLLGQTPVLLGIGVGDDSSPGVGAKKLEDIGPAERTTPAGRYVAKFGRAFGHQRVLWVDYANSVALHAVITTNKKEKRVQRLLSPSPDDNRISFGCINVGTPFYTRKLSPLLRKTGGVVYILPDTKTLDEVFPRLRLLPYLDVAAEREPAA